MSTAECSSGIGIQIICGILFLSVLIFYLRKLFKKNTSSTEFSETDISAILECKSKLAIQLKEIAQKTSEEAHLFYAGLCNLNNLTTINLKHRCGSLQEQIDSSLTQYRLRTEEQLEKLESSIVDLGKNAHLMRDSRERKISLEGQEGHCLEHLVENSSTQTQKEDGTGDVHEECSPEVLIHETAKVIMLAIKNCMDQIVIESTLNRDDFLKEISSFVQKHHKNIQELSYSIANESLEELRQLQIDILMKNTERIEKRLLEVFIFLDRKLVDVQAIEDTLKFFNRKFIKFADKCEIRWRDSCSRFDDSQELVFEARDNLIFSSSKMSRISCQLTQHASGLDAMASTLKFATQRAVAVAEAGDSSRTNNARIEEISLLVEDMKDTVAKIGEEYKRKMNEVSSSLEMPSKKLDTFLEYVKHLEVLNDLLKNNGEVYENITKQPLNRDGEGNKEPLGFPENAKEIETSSMVSVDECSSYQGGDGFTEFSFDNQSKNDENIARKDGHEDENRRHFPLERFISVLGDLISKTAVEYSEKDADYDGKLKDELQMESSVLDSCEPGNSHWTSIPSEFCLSDINSDCLIRNSGSSSSDEEPCNM